ncbi:RNA polymerase sigma factor, sigma-70 family [Belliella baltica DSM 15883]|uniref:RNA polymerase sigma factor, sigma-70 family n=1 Tax=Belliella baltica (strain DSM 15883 / CIP 108006 / LMG 21964 / BA134) TaxID=866536 RepID=I3Z710_BELBD|nr:sigma-70 family RNA polymerase sigma factor [Belliella baltica]AFL85028.1 RNA polymerase sigma factor, sigma-70 family [Belliella baltica DSM 15883]
MKINKTNSEDSILDDIKAGGILLNKALEYMYSTYYRLLESIILKNSGDEDDAADVIQDTFLAFVKMVQDGRFRKEAGVKSMLYSIARNLWITEIRKRKSTQNRHEIFEQGNDVEVIGVSVEIEKIENQKLILSLFESIGQKCKSILISFYYENLSMKDIMEKEDFSSEQVLRNKKYKCLKSLIEKVNGNEILAKSVKNALQND